MFRLIDIIRADRERMAKYLDAFEAAMGITEAAADGPKVGGQSRVDEQVLGDTDGRSGGEDRGAGGEADPAGAARE
jgi:hypothetical protein